MSHGIQKLEQVLIKHVQTEKSTLAQSLSKYTFAIHNKASKLHVKRAIAVIYKKEVLSVNIMNTPGKNVTFRGRQGQKKGYKKAIVTLAAGQTIESFA